MGWALLGMTQKRAMTAVVAVARVGLGLAALLAPVTATRAWVGPGRGPATTVLGRALGGRDIALGAGALLALRSGTDAELRRWAIAATMSDSVDTLVTLISWQSLPKRGRVMVLAASAGAAGLGTLAALA